MRPCLLLALVCGSGLWAEPPGAEDLQDLQQLLDQPVAAASKRLQRLKEAPADMSVLSAADLAAQGYRTLGEALDGVLGFRINRDRAYEGLGVRGLYVLGDQNTRVLILLDGHALNAPTEVGSSKVGEDFGIPLDFVERIEIIRGPASSLYGNNAFMGMVNVVTKSGERSALASGSSRSLSSLDASVGGSLEKGTWNVMVSGMQRTGSTTQFPELGGQVFPSELDREERQSAYFRASGTVWSASGYALSRTQRLSSAPFGSDLGSPGNLYRNRILFGDVRFEPKLGNVETLVRLYGDRNEFGSEMDYLSGRSLSQPGHFREVDPDRSLGLEAQVRMHASESLLLTLGNEFSRHRYTGLAGMEGAPISTQVDHDLGNSYLQADWTPLESFSAVAGLQASRWTVSRAQTTSLGQTTSMSGGTQTGLTPRLALIWLPSELDILKALWGGGYRNPTLFERFYDDGTSYRANPELQAEHITTAQLIWVHVWRDGLQSQLSATQSHWRDLIQSMPVPGVPMMSEFSNASSRLEGKALESEVKGRWPGWDLDAQAGWYQWRQAGSDMANVATWQAALRLTRRWEAWSLSGEVRHGGRRDNPSAEATVPAYDTLRAALRFEQPRYWLRLVVQDALDARPRHLVATDYDPITTMQEDGRTLTATLGLRF